MANVDVILPGYPQVIGSKNQYVVDHAGPLSYVTNGEVYASSNLGTGGFDKADGGTSYSATAGGAGGTYTVQIIYPAGSQGIGTSTVNLKWLSAGTEVAAGTNLNGQYVRLEFLSY